MLLAEAGGGTGTASADPEALLDLASALLGPTNALDTEGVRLQAALDAFTATRPELPACLAPLGDALRAHARAGGLLDAWVARVGQAFRSADALTPGSGASDALLTLLAGAGPDDRLDPGRVRDAVDRVREALDPGGWGVRRGDLEDITATLGALSPLELDAAVAALTDDELARWADQLGEGWLAGGTSEDQRRALHELLASSVSPATLERLRAHLPGLRDPRFDDVDGSSDGVAYVPLDVPLFVDGPSPGDVDQRGLGDCYLLSALMSLAATDPDLVRSLVRPNANGTVTVTFRDAEGDPVRVTVTPEVPARDGQPVFALPGEEAWVAAVEKAYAQWQGGGSYGAIEGGHPEEALQQLTGRESRTRDADDVTLEELAALSRSGAALTVSTHGPSDDETLGDGRVVARHAYMVGDVDVAAGTVRLVNPWGFKHATLTLDELREWCREVQVSER